MTGKDIKSTLWIGIALTIIGSIFLGVAIQSFNMRKYMKEVCKETTSGIVADYLVKTETREDEDGHRQEKKRWYQIFEYTVDGRTYTKQSDYSSSTREFELNEKVTVFYNSSNPNDYYVKEESFTAGVFNIALLIVAIGVLLLGGACIWGAWYEWKNLKANEIQTV